MTDQRLVLKTDSTSAPPKGQTLRLHVISVVEAFYREDYSKLKEGLIALATWAKDQDRRFFDFGVGIGIDGIESGLQFVDSAKYSPANRAAYLLLGSLVNRGNTPAVGMPMAIAVKLPSNLLSIKLSLHQALPSVVMVIAEAMIDQSEDTHGILSERYEGPNLLSHGTHCMPEELKTEAFQDYVWDIRSSIEVFLARFFPGVFLGSLGDSTTGCPSCPAVEIYSLDSIPLSKCERWLHERWRFLWCMGYRATPSQVYRSRNHLLFESEIPVDPKETKLISKSDEAWRIISSRWHYTGKRMPQGYSSPDFALVHKIGYEIPELLIVTALQRLIKLDMKVVASARDAIFADLDVSQARGSSLRTVFDQLAQRREELDEIRFRFERTKMEFGDGGFIHGLDPMRFERVKPLKPDAKDGLRQLMIDNIVFLMSTVESEMKLLDRKLATRLTLADRRLNLELQSRMDRFTKIAALATMVGVIVTVIGLGIRFQPSPGFSLVSPAATPTLTVTSPTINPHPTATITVAPTPATTPTPMSRANADENVGYIRHRGVNRVHDQEMVLKYVQQFGAIASKQGRV